jgi:hypothetical protein
VRHGTQCLIANFLVATGAVIAPTVGDTRTEADILAHTQQTVATAPGAAWIFITDRLDSHLAAPLVEWVATMLGDTQPLSKRYRSGILQSRQTRRAALADTTHRIRFAYVPKHASGLNQVEIWFSILVRRLLKRGSVTSVHKLRQRILQFICQEVTEYSMSVTRRAAVPMIKRWRRPTPRRFPRTAGVRRTWRIKGTARPI